MRRPSPARAELLREFIERRFSSNKDTKAQSAATKRGIFFSLEALDVIQQVGGGVFGVSILLELGFELRIAFSMKLQCAKIYHRWNNSYVYPLPLTL